MKEYLHHFSTLTSPRPGGRLYLYLSAADEAVSAMLIREEGVQILIYYVSWVLRRPETRYAQAEKFVLALIHAARRLKSYFLAHPIFLRTDQPLRQVLLCPETAGHLTKWIIELGEYDLSYESRTAIKTQALADFLADLTFSGVKETTSTYAEPQRWILYVDGSSNTSNNEVEYEAVIANLQLARRFGARHILVNSDFQLVVCQILGEYEVREEVMQRYLSKIHQLTAHFDSFEIQRVPQLQNKRIDALSRLAFTSFSDLTKTVLVEVLAEPGYLEEIVCLVYPEDT
ncbi:uncharacterized protein [Coffea arabica]|uniref:RNase H type-1 domain-containing protein n=1 Tax=Coffea arabica TaxID=13443 RepID=A0ABM4X4T8_COFAR